MDYKEGKMTDFIDLDPPTWRKSRKGTIKIGRSLVFRDTYLLKRPKYKKGHNFYLKEVDLQKHVFISGLTGTGKTNFVKSFLLSCKDSLNIHFLIIQFKDDFNFLEEYFENLDILSPGENFSIDIFNPGEINPLIHAERIYEMINNTRLIDESSEFSPQMEKVLVDVFASVCKSEGERNWDMFYQICTLYLKEHKSEIPMLAQTFISIKNRIRRFSEGPMKNVFSDKNLIPITEILNKNCVLNLSSIIRLGGSKEDAYFFLMLILKNMWDHNVSTGGYNRLKHLTIVDDATYFMPQEGSKHDKISSYLEDIALLQRGTGESLMTITTRPDISENILSNAGVVVGFATNFKRDGLAELLNLPKKKRHYLSLLDTGQCIIRTPSVRRPFLLQVPWINDKIKKEKFSKYEKINIPIFEKTQEIPYVGGEPKISNDFKTKSINKNSKKVKNIKSSFPGEKIIIKDLKERIIEAKKHYLSSLYEKCKRECQNIIEELLIQLSNRLNYEFSTITQFLNDLKKDQLSEKLTIYSDLNHISSILEMNEDTAETSKSDAKDLLKYTIKIFLNQNGTKIIDNIKNDNFSNAYIQYVKKIEDKIQNYEEIPEIKEDTKPNEGNEFVTLKKYIEELINLDTKQVL